MVDPNIDRDIDEFRRRSRRIARISIVAGGLAIGIPALAALGYVLWLMNRVAA